MNSKNSYGNYNPQGSYTGSNTGTSNGVSGLSNSGLPVRKTTFKLHAHKNLHKDQGIVRYLKT